MSTDTLIALRALIIDDQRTMRSIVRKLLSQLGIIDVMEAEGGTEALALLEIAGEEPR